MVELELLLDRIAEALIVSEYVDTTKVTESQKFIRNGQIQTGQGEGVLGVLALFQKDVEANVEDDLQSIANQIIGDFTIVVDEGVNDSVSITIVGGGFQDGGMPITDLVFGEGNPLNVSQFISLEQSSSIVNVDQAEEFLDTNIYELLPTGDTRQSRITRFFQELNALLPPESPNFDQDGVPGIDRLPGGDWSGSLQYSKENSISYAQDNTDGNIDEEDAFIHRLKFGAVPANSSNSSKTIEDIYNTIEPYLKDILEEPASPQDDRVVYTNQSNGYLEFRDLNQGIIVRNTSQDFIEGLDPNNPTWLTQTDGNVGTGFTITMWVRFLDKVSEGTLFNFGNPIREDNPFGFRLETFVISPDTPTGNSNNPTFDSLSGWSSTISADNPNGEMFVDTNTERFVRLIVRDPNTTKENYTGNFGNEPLPGIYDSHTASPHNAKQPYLMNPSNPYTNGSSLLSMLTTTRIPTDFNEWYFICASFNPNVTEPVGSGNTNSLSGDDNYASNAKEHNFWLNHITEDGSFTNSSDFGNKCKVEIISRSDLLRARGFKVE